eukprot:s79_g21.t1
MTWSPNHWGSGITTELSPLKESERLAVSRGESGKLELPQMEESTLHHLALGVLKVAQFLGDVCEKLGWKDAVSDLVRMVEHAWLRGPYRLPEKASVLKLLRQKADLERVQGLQVQLEDVASFQGSWSSPAVPETTSPAVSETRQQLNDMTKVLQQLRRLQKVEDVERIPLGGSRMGSEDFRSQLDPPSMARLQKRPAYNGRFFPLPVNLQAKANFHSARDSFTKIDRRVFEWLYILEEYRGDILDSLLQTLKYLHYELFSSAAHSISAVLPAAMVFRPMVEMVPEQLEPQVQQELQMSGIVPSEDLTGTRSFSHHLSEKAHKEGSDADAAAVVDLLSLSSLLSQAPARRALRLHGNRTQEALDWLVKGQPNSQPEGVRMPTTLKRTTASEDSLDR